MKSNPIKIVYFEKVLDSWGHKESSSKPGIIKSILQNENEWNDDMEFEDNYGNIYVIDDLIGKLVKVGDEEILVLNSKLKNL